MDFLICVQEILEDFEAFTFGTELGFRGIPCFCGALAISSVVEIFNLRIRDLFLFVRRSKGDSWYTVPGSLVFVVYWRN